MWEIAALKVAYDATKDVLSRDGRFRGAYGLRRFWQKPSPLPPKPPPDLAGHQYYAGTDDAIKDANPKIYTDTNSSDICKPSDVFQYLAQQIGFGSSSTNILTTASTFGSFTQARIDLDALTEVVLTGEKWNICYRIIEPELLTDSAARIMSQAPIAFWRSQYDGKVRAQVYKQTPHSWDLFKDPAGATYKWSWDQDIIRGSWSCSLVPRSSCYSEVHVKYDLHAPSGQYMKETWVGPTGSDDGTGTADEGGAGERTETADWRVDNMGIRNVLTVECDQIISDYVAVAFRNYLFDRHRPRILCQFDIWARCIGIEPHQSTILSDDLIDHVGPPPLYPGLVADAVQNWGDLYFFVSGPVRLRASPSGPIGTITLEELA